MYLRFASVLGSANGHAEKEPEYFSGYISLNRNIMPFSNMLTVIANERLRVIGNYIYEK